MAWCSRDARGVASTRLILRVELQTATICCGVMRAVRLSELRRTLVSLRGMLL